MNEAIDSFLGFIQDIDPVLRTVLAGVAIMLETSVLVGLIVPGDTVVLVASTGVDGILEYLSLAVVIIAGALVGESIGFAIGRYFGPKLRGGTLGARLGPERLAKADRFVDRRGGIAVFISRFLPVFHSVVPMVAGMSTMRYRRFMAWTTPACTLWSFIYVSVGAGAAETYRELKDQFDWAGWVFIGIFVVFSLLVWVVKHFLMRFTNRSAGEDVTEITGDSAGSSR
ncbi:DedA family protein [Pontimonas sp.]|jgi:membrane protein DedA with SNARE-associated domain|uniref:DedA family protein n=1 Tax=Pontimonas sp. TaxID=2304492 RepID=UPI002870574A|nr:DedA family protein [Pontimonas sp.]MDR9395929.1 DedA family protein [Pontimonas sp.]MDR9434094.1 DedA family protein [Pontimonas sp.]